MDVQVITFGSWMGGDREGNPSVTAQVTHNVACLARWIAADLYLREVDILRFEVRLGQLQPVSSLIKKEPQAFIVFLVIKE